MLCNKYAHTNSWSLTRTADRHYPIMYIIFLSCYNHILYYTIIGQLYAYQQLELDEEVAGGHLGGGDLGALRKHVIS